MSLEVQQVSVNRAFKGEIRKYKFNSPTLGGTDTQFNIFVPDSAASDKKAPLLTYLAGLTCTEDTGVQKALIACKAASENGIAVAFPDTSPRGAGIEGEDDDWDFGTGAGFYLNATHSKWAKHYNMKDFVTTELIKAIEEAGLPIDFKRQSIFGHSMGGHGALTLYLSSLESGKSQYRSASAFAPISKPSDAPWGHKAFKGYLSGGIAEGKENYDATQILTRIKNNHELHVLIDWGTADKFYEQKQLLPEEFIAAARASGRNEDQVQGRAQEGFDHSYFFVSTFIEEHVKFHSKYL